MQRNLEVDRLRSIAALIVMLGHIIYAYYPGVITSFPGFGITIIDLFFVISGYAISCVLVRQIDQLKSSPVALVATLKVFAVKRVLRIYPLLFAGFMLVFVLSFFYQQSELFSTPHNNIQAGLMILTSTYNFYFTERFTSLALSPFWSFAIEEQFYLAFPFFLLFTNNNRQRTKIFIGALLALTFIIRPLTFYYYGDGALFYSQTHIDAIIYGYLIYALAQQPWFEQLKPQGQQSTLLRMVFVATIFYVIISITTLDISPSIYLPISCLFTSALVLAGVFHRNIIAFPFGIAKLLDILAPRSFSMYIVHFPVILLFNEIYSSMGVIPTSQILFQKSCVAFLATLVVSEVFYRLIVKTSARAGKRIANDIIKNSGNPASVTESVTHAFEVSPTPQTQSP